MNPRLTPALDEGLSQLFAAAAAAGKRPTHEGTVEAAREAIESRAADSPRGPEIAKVHEVKIIAADELEVRARVYEPEVPLGSIVYFHGGGWVIGSVNSFDRVARTLVDTTGYRVISVDYRLAPESPYPAALDDARAALTWALDRYRADTIVVAGDSAGGNLAAVLAQECRDAGTNLAAQLLIYPVVDADFTTASHEDFRSVNYLLNSSDLEWYWNHYAPTTAVNRQDPSLSPRNGNLAGLPPTIIVVAGHDPLRDGVYGYAKALQHSANQTVLLGYPSMPHGFISLFDTTPTAFHVYQDISDALRRLLP